MPCTCPHCGKVHRTQEELEGGLIIEPAAPILIGDSEPEKTLPIPDGAGDEVSNPPDTEPLPHEFPPEEAPEEISEEYAPKKSKKSKKSEAAF